MTLPAMSLRTPVLSYTTPDNTRPTEPPDLQAEVLDDSRVFLTWSAATDNVAVAHYRIMDSGTQVAESSGTKFLHESLRRTQCTVTRSGR